MRPGSPPVQTCACLYYAVGPPMPEDSILDSAIDQYSWAFGRIVAHTLGSAYDDGAVDGSSYSWWRTIYLISGVFMMNYVTCSCVMIAMDMREQHSERKKQRYRLKVVLKERKVPMRLRHQIIRHFDQFWRAEGDSDEWQRLLNGVSRRLRMQLLMHTHRRLLSSPLFKDICQTSGGRLAVVLSMLEKMKTL
eukprot:6574635-Prymnesium_polylepis.1